MLNLKPATGNEFGLFKQVCSLLAHYFSYLNLSKPLVSKLNIT